MKKDIYIIKNDINNKVYIGQSKNVRERWLKHLSNSKRRNNQIISKAIKKYGLSHFWYEIIEKDVENYNEREKYWIIYYNSIVPNGYNVSSGGDGTGSGFDSCNSKINKNLLSKIIYDIKSGETFCNIAYKYGVSEEVISAINLGKRYALDEEKYPIRKRNLSEEDVIEIIDFLKDDVYSIKDICEILGVDKSVVSEINNGRRHVINGILYPIRKKRVKDISKNDCNGIIDLLKNTDIPQKDIARMYNLSISEISAINLGRAFFDENIDYPIRYNYQNRKPVSTIQ